MSLIKNMRGSGMAFTRLTMTVAAVFLLTLVSDSTEAPTYGSTDRAMVSVDFVCPFAPVIDD